MGGRYLVSGSQLGEIIALIITDPDEASRKVNEIIENQFIGNSNESIAVDVATMQFNDEE